MKHWILPAVVCAPLWGQYVPNVQFSDLATTRDGRVLYASSPLMLRGDSEYADQKIFRFDDPGITVAVQIAPSASMGLPYPPNFYNGIEPDVSGDGSVFSFVAQRPCRGGSSCLYVELFQSHIAGAGAEVVYTGRTRLSRNGRYALRYGATGLRMPGDPVPSLIDLSLGTSAAVPGVIPEGRQVASDGTVLTWVGGAATLWKAGVSQTLSLGAPTRVVLSDNAAALAAELPLPDGRLQLVLYDVASATSTAIVARSTASFHASLSDDGRSLCYVFAGEVYLYDRSTGTFRAPNPAGGDIVEAVISGDGSTIWEATGSGRILRVDVGSGAVREVVPRTPLITSVVGAPVPGSLNWLYGSGLNDVVMTAQSPLPDHLGGQSVLLNSTRARMLSVSPQTLVYQIPFEVTPGTYTVGFAANASPFDPPLREMQIVESYPTPVLFQPQPGCCNALAAHGDFSLLIDAAHPALPSEVVHVYFTGLGAVTPPLASGVAAPVDRTSPAVQTPMCQYFAAPGVAAPADILFAGMAPGLIGIYQVDLRLPQSVTGFGGNAGQVSVIYTCGEQVLSIPMDFGR